MRTAVLLTVSVSILYCKPLFAQAGSSESAEPGASRSDEAPFWGRDAEAMCYEAESLRIRGEMQEAEMLASKGLHLARENADVRGQAVCLLVLGDLAYYRGENEKAEKLYRDALGFFEQAQDPLGQGNVWDGIAQVRVREGKAQEALALYDKAIGLYRAQEHRFNEMWTRYRKGQALEGLGGIEEALKEYEKACELADYLVENIGGGERERLELRGRLFEIHEAAIRLHFERKRESDGRGEQEVAAKEMASAFRLMEQARAQALLRRIRELGMDLAKRVLPETLRKEEEGRLQRIAFLRARLAKERENETLSEELQRLEEEQKRFENTLWDSPQYVPYAAVRYPRPVDPSRLALGPEEVLVEFFVGESGVYRFVVFRGQLEEFERVEGEVKDLEQEVARLRADIQRVLEDRMFVFQSRASRSLYEKLLKAAVEKVPKGGRLVVVPDGFLWALPFEVLDMAKEGEGPRYLGLEVPVVRAPSARSLEWLRRQGQGMVVADREILAVGDPVYVPEEDGRCEGRSEKVCGEPKGAELRRVQKACARAVGQGVERKKLVASRRGGGEGLRGVALRAGLLERLCASRHEVRMVVEGFDANKRDVLLDLDATKARVMELLRQHTYRVVHFATHGLLPEHPQCEEGEGGLRECLDEPALVLAATGGSFRDQMLSASEVFETRVPAQVVTLSACRTGEGRVVRGEGVLGMGQAFLYAGARSVVMSLWPVSDSSAEQWMRAFYAAMQGGKDLAHAAMEARLAVARGGSDGKNIYWSHPFFWAPFVLVGLPR